MTFRSSLATDRACRGSVSATYFLGIVEFAVACGASRAQLLAACDVSEGEVAMSDTRLPLRALALLFDVSAATLDDPAFALRFGVGVPCAQLTLASALAAARPESAEGPAARVAPEQPLTLRDALHGLNRYAALGVDFGTSAPDERYRFVDSAEGVWLEDRRPELTPGDPWPALTESVFARFATGIRRRGGEAIVRALEVRHAAPSSESHRAAYEAVFRVPVRFGAARNALCLDPAFLDNPLEPLATPVHNVLTAHADAQLRALRAHESWRSRVEALVVSHLAHGSAATRHVSLDAICRELAVSRHTLHRRLRDESASFSAIVDDARRRLADSMLREQQLSVGVVASRLGFSEPAAFSRAYKRWTGTRPSGRLSIRSSHEREPLA